MDLSLSKEQEEIRRAVRDVLSEKSGTDVVRAMEQDEIGYPPELWTALAEVGLPGLLIDERFGGYGLGWEEVALAFEEIGRAIAPSPIFETAIIATGLLDGGREELKESWLPRIASGDARFTVAWREPNAGTSAAGIHVVAEEQAGTVTLNGTKLGVSYANSVDRIVVLARSGAGDEGIDIVLVDPRADGVDLVAVESLGSTVQFNLHLNDVKAPVSERVNAPGEGWALWSETLLRARIALGAWSVGVADRALQLATDYAREREQFGRPIGGFQGVSHPLANVAKDVTSNRLLVQEAAWAVDSGKPYRFFAAMVGERAPETARVATKVAHQVFGGIGFTNAIDIQLYSRRAKERQLLWDDHKGLTAIIADLALAGTEA